VSTLCRLLGVSRSGYCAWRTRPPSDRAKANAELTEEIRDIHLWSRGTYGSPRVHAELRARGHRVGLNRVARLMREAGLRGASRRRPVTTTRRDEGVLPAPDLVDRDFEATGPDRLWVADITYVPTTAGFFYLSVVLDAWSRRVVGWSMATHLKTKLVLDALDMAVHQHQPEEVIHHSDQGTQYTPIAFGQRCREAGIRPSMGSVGDAYDNALCESFFASLECELIERNEIVEAMLRGASWRWLMFLDSDQTFPEDIIHRLWATSEETGAGIAAAPVTGRHRADAFSFGWVNAIHLDPGFEADDPMNLTDDPTWLEHATYVHAREIDRDGEPFEVDLAMTGATLFRQEVFEAVDGPPWFIPSRQESPGGCEDVNFAYRAREAGVKQIVDPRVKVGHVGPIAFGVEDAQMANAQPQAARPDVAKAVG
jgi:putative transposase